MLTDASDLVCMMVVQCTCTIFFFLLKQLYYAIQVKVLVAKQQWNLASDSSIEGDPLQCMNQNRGTKNTETVHEQK